MWSHVQLCKLGTKLWVLHMAFLGPCRPNWCFFGIYYLIELFTVIWRNLKGCRQAGGEMGCIPWLILGMSLEWGNKIFSRGIIRVWLDEDAHSCHSSCGQHCTSLASAPQTFWVGFLLLLPIILDYTGRSNITTPWIQGSILHTRVFLLLLVTMFFGLIFVPEV